MKSRNKVMIGKALLTCMEYFNPLLMPFDELIGKIPVLPMNKEFQRAKVDRRTITQLNTLILKCTDIQG
jgi:hypothetical protein